MNEGFERLTNFFIIDCSNVACNVESRFVTAHLTGNVSSQALFVAVKSVCGKAGIESFAQTLPVRSVSSTQWQNRTSCAFLVCGIKCCPGSVQADTKSVGQDLC